MTFRIKGYFSRCLPDVSDLKSRFGGFFGFLYSLAFAR